MPDSKPRFVHPGVALALVLALVFLPLAAQVKSVAPPAPPLDLLKGATWQYSTDGGDTYTPDAPLIRPEQPFKLKAKVEFQVGDLPAGALYWEFTHALPMKFKPVWKLNDLSLKGQITGASYRTFFAQNLKLLKKGRNSMTLEISGRNSSTKEEPARPLSLDTQAVLAVVKAEHLRIRFGPVLGAFGEDYFTVTFLTNMPASGMLQADPVKFTDWTLNRAPEVDLADTGGFAHRFLARRGKGDSMTYSVSASLGGANCRLPGTTVQFPPAGGKLRFVVTGDNRSNPKLWAAVAEAIEKEKPAFVVHTGDFVWNGNDDHRWEDEFYAPARELLRTTPFLPAFGNHEANAPMLQHVFYTPSPKGTARNWTTTIGPVQFIGIDGAQKWLPDGNNTDWLDKALAESRSKFLFLVSHYPAWSSGTHGKLDWQGEPSERPIRQGQDVIMPLLERHKATAYLAGHDHRYERSEPPGGVSVVVTGGGGAPLHKKKPGGEAQNPYSEVLEVQLHYCLFEIDGDTCVMKAITPEGEQLDIRTWKARK
jgi:hypothetical protein